MQPQQLQKFAQLQPKLSLYFDDAAFARNKQGKTVIVQVEADLGLQGGDGLQLLWLHQHDINNVRRIRVRMQQAAELSVSRWEAHVWVHEQGKQAYVGGYVSE